MEHDALKFEGLLDVMLKKNPERAPYVYGKCVLALDPGHTTGWARFFDGKLLECGQVDTSTIAATMENVQPLLHGRPPDVVVMEDYRVYRWKQKQHVGSEMMTTQVIGAIEILALQDFVPYVYKQPAHVAKQFCTDTKLKLWGYYQPGQRHARDAIRHGCYWLLFGAIDPKQRNKGAVG